VTGASAFLPFAEELADAAKAETLGRFVGAIPAENKAAQGYDPVTEADRAAERAMRALIERRYPDHGVAGEEYGRTAGAGRWTWSLDPIDGTRAYVCGLPCWTTLIGLLDGDEPVLGVVDAPRLGERLIAAEGMTTQGGVPVRTSGCTRLAEARLSTTDPALFRGAETEAWARLQAAAQVTRLGLDGYAYLKLAMGDIDLVVEAGLHPHDWHALVPVVEGAGGFVCDWAGGRELGAGRIVAAASEALARGAVPLLRSSRV